MSVSFFILISFLCGCMLFDDPEINGKVDQPQIEENNNPPQFAESKDTLTFEIIPKHEVKKVFKANDEDKDSLRFAVTGSKFSVLGDTLVFLPLENDTGKHVAILEVSDNLDKDTLVILFNVKKKPEITTFSPLDSGNTWLYHYESNLWGSGLYKGTVFLRISESYFSNDTQYVLITKIDSIQHHSPLVSRLDTYEYEIIKSHYNITVTNVEIVDTSGWFPKDNDSAFYIYDLESPTNNDSMPYF